MARAAVDCPNHQINLQMCPCTNEGCDNRGICCDCMRNHVASTEWPLTACMRGIPRPESSMSLPKTVPADCPNHEINVGACPCTADTCERRGTCCACVRHHWLPEGTKGTACMRPRM